MPGSLLILTGAGVSAESGVSTFRDPDGVWAKHDFRELATPEAFAADPQKVHGFYNARRAQLPSVEPNLAHFALADLEREWIGRGGDFLLVTQNVDDLHERAGLQRLVHMHGELRKMRCLDCGNQCRSFDRLTVETQCPSCGRAGGLRPDIVWFGETPMAMELIFSALEACTHFAAIGTSGTVYPAAGFSQIAKQAGARLTELNLETTDMSPIFDEAIAGPAGETVPLWAKALLAS